MKIFLQAQGFDSWKAVITKYTVPIEPLLDHATKRTYEDNSKEMNAILSSLTKTVFVKVMHCKTAKEIWDKPKNCWLLGSDPGFNCTSQQQKPFDHRPFW